MAYIMNLNPPVQGMNRMLNVAQKVGPHADCVNLPGDVEAVQRLMAIVAQSYAGTHHFGLPQPTGRLDPLLGFYIYELQYRRKMDTAPTTVVDGCISPARGIVYGGGVWAIAELNFAAMSQDRAAWEAVLARFANNAPHT